MDNKFFKVEVSYEEPTEAVLVFIAENEESVREQLAVASAPVKNFVIKSIEEISVEDANQFQDMSQKRVLN